MCSNEWEDLLMMHYLHSLLCYVQERMQKKKVGQVEEWRVRGPSPQGPRTSHHSPHSEENPPLPLFQPLPLPL